MKIRIVGRFATPLVTPAGTPPLSSSNSNADDSEYSEMECDADDELDEVSQIDLKKRGRSRKERKVDLCRYLHNS